MDDIDPASDDFHNIRGDSTDLVDCKLTPYFFDQLKNGLQDDDPDQYYKKSAE